MSAERRTVRATKRFFDDLDRQLPGERGPNGEPPQTISMCSIYCASSTNSLATGTSSPSSYPDDPNTEILLATGNVVALFAVIAQLAQDGAVELVHSSTDR